MVGASNISKAQHKAQQSFQPVEVQRKVRN